MSTVTRFGNGVLLPFAEALVLVNLPVLCSERLVTRYTSSLNRGELLPFLAMMYWSMIGKNLVTVSNISIVTLTSMKLRHCIDFCSYLYFKVILLIVDMNE